jgi:putative transposase
LNIHWFLSLEDAYEKISNWVNEYNTIRSHSSLNDMTPEEFVKNHISKVNKNETLPGASIDEGMYFASVEDNPAVKENIYLHQQILMPSTSPKTTI